VEMVSIDICGSGGSGEQVPVCLETGLFTQIKKIRKEIILTMQILLHENGLVAHHCFE